MNSKKHLLATFSVLLIAALLVACAGPAAAPTATPVPPTAAPTPVPPTATLAPTVIVSSHRNRSGATCNAGINKFGGTSA